MLIHVPADCPPPEELDFDQRWGTIERALVTCWLRGRALRTEQGWQEKAQRAAAGELPSIVFDGGSDGSSKPGAKRTGVLQYLAIWQGIRGDDLKIDTEETTTLTCTATGAVVTFRLTPLTDPGAPVHRAGSEPAAAPAQDSTPPSQIQERPQALQVEGPVQAEPVKADTESEYVPSRPREGQSALF